MVNDTILLCHADRVPRRGNKNNILFLLLFLFRRTRRPDNIPAQEEKNSCVAGKHPLVEQKDAGYQAGNSP